VDNNTEIVTKRAEYMICASDLHKCSISGTMRLAGPLAYENEFKPIFECIATATDTVELDVTGLTYLNSSGITAIARLIIHARNKDKVLRILSDNTVPWQKRSLVSLVALWEKLTIKPVT